MKIIFFLLAILLSTQADLGVADPLSVQGKGLQDIFLPIQPLPTTILGMNTFANERRFGSVKSQFREVTSSLGIKYHRILMVWSDQIQSSPGASLSLGFYDELVRQLPSTARAVVVVYGLPKWLQTAKWTPEERRSLFLTQFLSPLTSRYRRHRKKIIAWQVWNEPNMEAVSENGALGFDDPSTYFQFLQEGRRLVKKASSRYKVVSAATTAINQNFPNTLQYNKTLSELGIDKVADIRAFHYYGTHLENVYRSGGVKDFFDSVTAPIWVTESGAKGVLQQKEYASRVFPFLQKLIPSLKRIFIYQFTETTPADQSYGLRTLDPRYPVSDLYLALREEKRKNKTIVVEKSFNFSENSCKTLLENDRFNQYLIINQIPMTAQKKAIIHFALEDMEVEVPVGTSFIDAAEASHADVTFGCRNGTCGTCRVRIEEGLEHLSEMGREEKDFLESMEAAPNERLGCQVCVLGSCKITYIGL